MGIDYSFSLVYGFEMSEEEAEAPWKKTEKNPGKFHMEDRFDPKTGAKRPPVKVWDINPSTESWLEIDGKKYDEPDPEEFDEILAKKFGCNVEGFGSWPSGELTKVFFVNKSVGWKEADDYGRVTIYNNTIPTKDLEKLVPKAIALRDKLREAGYKVGEPEIFIATRIT